VNHIERDATTRAEAVKSFQEMVAVRAATGSQNGDKTPVGSTRQRDATGVASSFGMGAVAEDLPSLPEEEPSGKRPRIGESPPDRRPPLWPATPASQTPVTSSWPCEQCTYMNDAPSDKCTMCDTPRSNPTPSPAFAAPIPADPTRRHPQPSYFSGRESWWCQKCTIENTDASAASCYMCQAPRPNTGEFGTMV
jgi:hypothetical protein